MNNSILDIKHNQKQFMTKEGYRKFNLLLQKEKVSDIWNEDAPTEELYSRWNKAVVDSKKQCMSERGKKNNTSKKMKIMKQIIKRLKRQKKRSKNREQKDLIMTRMTCMKKHIENELKKEKANKIYSTVQKLRKKGGGLSESSFWEVRKEIEGRKKDECKVINNTEGKRVYKKKKSLKHTKNSIKHYLKNRQETQQKSNKYKKTLNK